uniref:non-specific serine/threonine protein kinase n=1 Tax=Macrostomum lignano TaxID=282301 RepID=A0A1I8I7J9_9PLAT
WCKCAALCMTAMAHLKFGESEEAERLAMELQRHQTLFTARLSQPLSSHLYVNFRCLSWSLQAELLRNRAPAIAFDHWIEQLLGDPDLEELLTLAHYSDCREHVELSLQQMEMIEKERRVAMETQDEEKIGWICSALAYIHNRKQPVIHRDINCSNIIVLEDSRKIKLIDFGLSIILKQSMSHISSSSQYPKGTLNFMAPELLGSGGSDSLQYSRQSDIWAFGCSVYQMATGARPLGHTGNIFQMALILSQSDAPPLPDCCSSELQNFYGCCTTRNRQDRKSASELMEHPYLVTMDTM